MENVKKNNLKVKIVCYTLIFIFMFLYLAGKTGYYENNMAKKEALTKEAILNFEKDVAEGKAVDLKDYVDTEVEDFNNRYSNLGYKISNFISVLFNDGLGWIIKIVKTLFT